MCEREKVHFALAFHGEITAQVCVLGTMQKSEGPGAGCCGGKTREHTVRSSAEGQALPGQAARICPARSRSGWRCGGGGGSVECPSDHFPVLSGIRNKVISREGEGGGGVESLWGEEGVK